jgi:hypothetical protein
MDAFALVQLAVGRVYDMLVGVSGKMRGGAMMFAFSIDRWTPGAREAGAWVYCAYKSGMAFERRGHVTHIDMRASRCMCSSSFS